MAKITKGTKEWASSNVNCLDGCSHNCLYCYAKGMAIRFKRKTSDNWKEMTVVQDVVDKKFKKRTGRIMFPTSHDILPEEPYFSACMTTLEHLLKAGNEVLVTTKPHFKCIQYICEMFPHFKEQVQFRFTIGSMHDAVLEFWEPGAPKFEERLQSLQFAHANGWKTSISIEPMLEEPTNLISVLLPYVTETIWVGPMNHCPGNIDVNAWQVHDAAQMTNKYVLKDLYAKIQGNPVIRFKDAFLNKIGKQRPEEEAK